ncbi:MAG TPA: hypothetical protein PL110_00765, partial [Candidatus Eremiobacteraeota bacterium]|nr:hypothetical protein [Candidatus Eremiobacteraeota bacterium]
MKINSQNFTPIMKNGNSKNVKPESIFMADSFTREEKSGILNAKSGDAMEWNYCFGGGNEKASENSRLNAKSGDAMEWNYCFGGGNEKASENSGLNAKAGDAMEWNYCFGGGNEKAS